MKQWDAGELMSVNSVIRAAADLLYTVLLLLLLYVFSVIEAGQKDPPVQE